MVSGLSVIAVKRVKPPATSLGLSGVRIRLLGSPSEAWLSRSRKIMRSISAAFSTLTLNLLVISLSSANFDSDGADSTARGSPLFISESARSSLASVASLSTTVTDSDGASAL